MDSSRTTFLETADALGARLCRDALWAGRRCNWLGASMEVVGGRWQAVQRLFGPDVYAGTSGIALFLGRLYGLVEERIYRMTALGAAQQALSRVEDFAPTARLSFYSGVTGLAYTLLALAPRLGEERFEDRALDLLRGLEKERLDGHGVDVLTGYAGAIPGLLAIYQRCPQDFLLELAVRCGDQLVQTARREAGGRLSPGAWSWNTLGVPETQRRYDLLGFSHGTAGIAWVLLELHRQTGQDRFREAAEGAFQYEAQHYNPQQMNWPDFRGLNEPPPGASQEPGYMVAWCHGAAGIGLSRLRSYELTGAERYRREAETAVQTTARMLEASMAGGQLNYSLCHGMGGNADLLLYAGRVLENPAYRSLAETVGRFGAERYGPAGPWPCGVPEAGETPGLFLGLAGIGYFYLRLHDPEQTPSVTLLPITCC